MDAPLAPVSPARRFGRALRNRTFRSLQHPNYRRYFFGQLISFVGTWVQSTAVIWLAYDLTNDPGWPAYLMVAQVGPTLVVGPLGGALADHFPKRSVILATQLAFMINALTLTLLVGSNLATPMLLLVLQCISGIIQGIDLPARLAVVTDLVPTHDLVNAVGLNSLLFNSARAVGPAIAGLFFVIANTLFGGAESSTRLGAVACFAANTISFTAVLLALSRIESPPNTETKKERGSIWDGLHYLRLHWGLIGLMGLTGTFCMFAWPVLTLMPSYTREVLGQAEGTYSLLLSSFGTGALIGALGTATFGSIHRRGQFLLTGAILGGIGLIILLLASGVTFAMLAGLFLGLGMVLYLSTGQSTMQTCVPNRLRGRTMALWAMMLSASSLPGHLMAGLLARWYSVPDVLLLMFGGVTLTILGLIVLLATKPFPHQG